MKSLKSCILICTASLSLGFASCDRDYDPDPVEVCIILSKEVPGDIDEWEREEIIELMKSSTCFCTNNNLPEDERQYIKPLYYCRAYQAVSVDNYHYLNSHWDLIVEKLIKCELEYVEDD